MSQIIGALRVILSAETAQFEKSMRDTQSRLKAFQANVGKAAAGVAASFAGIGAVVGVAVTSALKEADRLGQISRSIGVPVEKLSELKHAAEQTGAGFENLTTGMRTLAKNMADAAGNAQSQVAAAFAAIGVSVTSANGQMKASNDVLLEIAERFAGMRDGAGKTALAMQVFGDAGAQMITMLNQGRTGLNAMAREARELGIVISSDTERAAKNFTANLDRLAKVQKGLWMQLSAELAPTLAALSTRMVELSREGGSLKAVIRDVAGAFENVAIWADRVAVSYRILRIAASGWMDSWSQTAEQAKLAREKITAEIAGILDEHRRFMTEVSDGNPFARWAAAGAAMRDALLAPAAAAEKTAEKFAVARAALQALLAERPDNLATFAMRINELDNALAAKVINLEQYTQMLAGVHRAMEEFKRSDARESLTDIIGEATTSFAEKQAALKQALDGGTISMREYGRTMKQVHAENTAHVHDMASAVSSSLTTIFGKSKTAAIASAVINTAQAITKNLSQYPMPFGGIMAAIAAASGAAQIAAIKSTNMGSGGGGGSARSAAAATPVINQQQTLTVQGFNPNDLFRGEQVREIAQKLLDYQRDGGRVLLQGG